MIGDNSVMRPTSLKDGEEETVEGPNSSRFENRLPATDLRLLVPHRSTNNTNNVLINLELQSSFAR